MNPSYEHTPYKGESSLDLCQISTIAIFSEDHTMILEFRSRIGKVVERFNLGKSPRRQRYKTSNGPCYYLVDIYGTRIDFERPDMIRISGSVSKIYDIDSELYEKCVRWLDGLDKKVR